MSVYSAGLPAGRLVAGTGQNMDHHNRVLVLWKVFCTAICLAELGRLPAPRAVRFAYAPRAAEMLEEVRSSSGAPHLSRRDLTGSLWTGRRRRALHSGPR